MELIKQGDIRWGKITMGGSGVSLAYAGCVTSCVSMASSYFKCFKNPGVLAKELSYTPTGLLFWKSINKVLCFKFLWRGYKDEQKVIDEALRNPKKACLLNVMSGLHWVLGIYRIPFTSKYWVADPIDGKRKFYSGVVGYSILTK
jgi:hypothetical protein